MASPHAPRPTRVASYALHFQIPILPMPTPPSLLKRQSSSTSSASWSSAVSSSNNSSNSVTSSRSSSAGSTPATTPSPRTPGPMVSPISILAPRASPATSCTSRHRRTSSIGASSLSFDETPITPYSTPLDTSDLSFPAFSDTRPPLLRRDTPRPGVHSRHIEVDEFDAEFGRTYSI